MLVIVWLFWECCFMFKTLLECFILTIVGLLFVGIPFLIIDNSDLASLVSFISFVCYCALLDLIVEGIL